MTAIKMLELCPTQQLSTHAFASQGLIYNESFILQNSPTFPVVSVIPPMAALAWTEQKAPTPAQSTVPMLVLLPWLQQLQQVSSDNLEKNNADMDKALICTALMKCTIAENFPPCRALGCGSLNAYSSKKSKFPFHPVPLRSHHNF